MNDVVKEFSTPVDIQSATAAPSATEPQRPRLRPYTWDELHLLPEPDYLIKHVLDAGCMSVVYGDSGSGKTFFALDLALHISLGWLWRERRVKQGRVVYIAAEAGMSIKKRLKAMEHHFELTEAPPLLILPVSVDLCRSHDDTEGIAKEIGSLGGASLIVVDTLSRAMAGGNENAPDDMSAFVDNIDRLNKLTRAHVLVVHHTGKDAAKGARGHSSLRAATDTEISVTDDAGIRTAKISKQRDGVAGETIAFSLKIVEIGTDQDGDPVSSCVVIEAERVKTDTAHRLTPNQATVLGLLDDFGPGGATVEEWNDAARQEGLGVKRKADLSDFRRGLKDKRLVHTTNDRWYVTKL